MEKQARWLVSESLPKQVASKSPAFAHLIEFEQCHVLLSNLLSEEDRWEQGPFFVADGTALKSLVGHSHDIWTMAIVPTKPSGRMPSANLLKLTPHTWTLFYRNETGHTKLLSSQTY